MKKQLFQRKFSERSILVDFVKLNEIEMNEIVTITSESEIRGSSDRIFTNVSFTLFYYFGQRLKFETLTRMSGNQKYELLRNRIIEFVTDDRELKFWLSQLENYRDMLSHSKKEVLSNTFNIFKSVTKLEFDEEKFYPIPDCEA